MDSKFAIAIALAAALLLFGCVVNAPANPPQQEQKTGGSGQMVGNDRDSHGCIGSAGYTWCEAKQACIRPWETNCTTELNVVKQKDESYTCSLTLNPSTIYAGDSIDINFAVQTKGDVVFTYNCGQDIREISTGGLTGGSRLCQFNTAGEQEVWIKADGVICAQKTLNVLSRNDKPRNCSVRLVNKDLNAYTYEMRVDWEGFDAPITLSWTCDGTIASRTYQEDPVLGLQKYETIDCNFNGKPKRDFIPVTVGGVSCGEISTR